jgi:hypothetical protein
MKFGCDWLGQVFESVMRGFDFLTISMASLNVARRLRKELDMAKGKDRRKEKKKPKQPKQPKTK